MELAVLGEVVDDSTEDLHLVVDHLLTGGDCGYPLPEAVVSLNQSSLLISRLLK